MKITHYSILLLSILFISCEDLLVKELDIKEDFDFERKMAISGQIETGDSLFVCLVSENQSILETNSSPIEIPNVNVRLFKDGQLLSSLDSTSDANFSTDLSLLDDATEPGLYRLEAEHPDFGVVYGESTLPEPVSITDIKVDSSASGVGSLGGGTYSSLLSFVIPDPEEDNYYGLKFDISGLDTFIYEIVDGQFDTLIYSYQGYVDFETTEPGAINNYGNEILFSDEFFNNTNHKVSINFNIYNGSIQGDFSGLKIEWVTLSKELYEFKKSYFLYQTSQDFGIFQEPVSVFSNIVNGQGYFGCGNKQLIPIE